MIITTCPRAVHNGVWRHLKELEDSTLMTTHHDSEDLVRGFPNGTSLIISGGGWIDKYKKINEIAITNNIKTGLLFCSPFGQADLNNEQIPLLNAIDLLMFGKINYLFTGDKIVADVLRKVLNTDKVRWLPQTMDYVNTKIAQNCVDNSVGLFGNTNRNKNILNQLIGAKLANRKLITNCLDKNINHVANEFNIDYDRYDWLSDKEYAKLMKTPKVGLQVSWSESFDYVAAEISLRGISVVTGETIYWNLKSLRVSKEDDPREIAKKINFAFDNLGKKGFRQSVRDNIIKELDYRSKYTKKLFKELLNR